MMKTEILDDSWLSQFLENVDDVKSIVTTCDKCGKQLIIGIQTADYTPGAAELEKQARALGLTVGGDTVVCFNCRVGAQSEVLGEH